MTWIQDFHITDIVPYMVDLIEVSQYLSLVLSENWGPETLGYMLILMGELLVYSQKWWLKYFLWPIVVYMNACMNNEQMNERMKMNEYKAWGNEYMK